MEIDFNKNLENANKKLKNLEIRDYNVEKKLEDFANMRETYSKYLIHKIPGNLERYGSTQSEQNHSSVLSHLNEGNSNHNYMSEPYTLIKDLIQRQKDYFHK